MGVVVVSDLSFEEQQAQLDADYKAKSAEIKAKAMLHKESQEALTPALEQLTKYAEFISDEQKKQVASIFGLTAKATTKRATKRATKSTGPKLYILNSGAEYGGKGPPPQEFLDFEESAEGKKLKADTGKRWPLNPKHPSYKAK